MSADTVTSAGPDERVARAGLLKRLLLKPELGALIGADPERVEAFIRSEKRGTLQPVWDLWRGPQSDWFATVDCAIVAGRSYVEGLNQFLGGELGMKVAWSSGRPRRVVPRAPGGELTLEPPPEPERI